MANVIIWSGGADSTALLNYYAGVSSKDYPVRAITVSSHPNMHKLQMDRQRECQDRYLSWAKKRGYWINRETIKISGEFKIGVPDDDKRAPPQMILWLGAIMPCVSTGDRVMFAYIRNDGMWHYKGEFIAAFNSMCAINGVEAEVKFPFERTKKYEILDRLKKGRVPQSCWWTCESPVGKKACGKCNKCNELKMARFEGELDGER